MFIRDEAVKFFRGFFGNTFKTNPHLCRGIITGITRITKESIFSDLNNLDVVTTTSKEYAASFGFTQDEAFHAPDNMGLGGEKENDNVRKMNTSMNRVALETYSSFDSGNKFSEETQPERIYHGFVLGMVVNLAGRYKVRSNRERGQNELCSFGRYDVMIEPLGKSGKAFIFEFKVMDADDDEETLEDTFANELAQIEERQYEAELTAEGFEPEQIRKYGFAFQGKKCLIG